MRRHLVSVVLTCMLVLGPAGLASPSGVGEQGNDGCLCHVGPSLEETTHLHGWPEVYEAGATYMLHVNASTAADDMGGFRLVVNAGTLLANTSSTVQDMDGGLTHVAPSSLLEGWQVAWVAPNSTDEAAQAVLHVNLVNENGAPDGDQWATTSMVAVGPTYEGPIEEWTEESLTTVAVVFAALGLLVTIGLLAVVLREPGEE